MATPATGSLCTPVTAATGAATNKMSAIEVDMRKAACWRIDSWDDCLVDDMAASEIAPGFEFSAPCMAARPCTSCGDPFGHHTLDGKVYRSRCWVQDSVRIGG